MTGTVSPPRDEQRAFARIEHRGGVEAYLATAGRVVAEEGAFVMCGDARATERVARGAAAAGLRLHARCDVIPRAGERPLFAVWELGRRERVFTASSMTLRDVTGARTEDARSLRAFAWLEG